MIPPTLHPVSFLSTCNMAPSDFRKADIPSVVEKLTLEEAVSLTAGVGSWRTHAVPRLDIPAIKVCTTVFFLLSAAHAS